VLLLSQHLELGHSLVLAGSPGFGYLLKDRVLDLDEFLASVWVPAPFRNQPP
jgi:hypothetical protein